MKPAARARCLAEACSLKFARGRDAGGDCAIDELLFFLIKLIAEALGLKKKQVALPPVPLASAQVPASLMPPRPPLTSDPLRTIARPAGDDQTLVPQQATTTGFTERVSQGVQGEPARFDTRAAGQSLPPASSQVSSSLTSLFSSSDDFVRAFVMQEILQPPRSLRPHAPAFRPSPIAPPPPAEPPN